jgi:hypothetical protein
LNRESRDHIKGRDGICIHAVGFLAGAGGSSTTTIATLLISCLPVFNIECAKRLKIALEVCIWGGFQRFALGMLQIRVKVNSHIDAD